MAEPAAASPAARTPANRPARPPRDRSRLARLWYGLVWHIVIALLAALCGLRATGRRHLPPGGGVLLVANHLSYLDVFVLGVTAGRPLNYVARSTLFLPGLGPLIRSVGGFAIQREGMGAQGLKETLRRLRAGGVVLLFPEGTRSRDGELGPLKPGIAALASRAGVPVLPAGLAGTFEVLPRRRAWPRPHPIRIHFGPPIQPEDLAGLGPEQVTALIRARILDSRRVARRALARDLGPGRPDAPNEN